MSEISANVMKETWKKLVTKAWGDSAFRSRLLADPAGILKENGVVLPSGIQCRVVENTDALMHLVLPSQPSEELSDEELDQVAGGAKTLRCMIS